jgi:hypothetical protein
MFTAATWFHRFYMRYSMEDYHRQVGHRCSHTLVSLILFYVRMSRQLAFFLLLRPKNVAENFAM